MRNKKVIFLSSWNTLCSISYHTKNVIEQLQAMGYECEVFGIDIDTMKSFSLQGLKNYFNPFFDKIKNFDLVHIQHEHSFFSGALGIEASYEVFGWILRKIYKPCLISFHSNPLIFHWIHLCSRRPCRYDLKMIKFYYIWHKEIASIINRKNGLFLSQAHTKFHSYILRYSGIKKKHIRITYVGIDDAPRIEDREILQDTKLQLGLKDKFIISIFGFIVPVKGYKLAIDAIKSLPDNFHLLIIGGKSPYQPAYYDEVIAYIKNIPGLDARITITGYLDKRNADLHIALSDIAIAPYLDDFQASTGAVIQCLKSGIPVITSDIPIFKELNDEAGCFEIFKKKDTAELIKKITKLHSDASYRNNIAEKGFLFAKANSWKNYTTKISEIYRGLLKGRADE